MQFENAKDETFSISYYKNKIIITNLSLQICQKISDKSLFPYCLFLIFIRLFIMYKNLDNILRINYPESSF